MYNYCKGYKHCNIIVLIALVLKDLKQQKTIKKALTTKQQRQREQRQQQTSVGESFFLQRLCSKIVPTDVTQH